jgi:hypothetical protein
MEDITFDSWTRAFGVLTSRRLTLGALLSGALTPLGLAYAKAKPGQQTNGRGDKGGGHDVVGEGNKNCNPACGECQTCNKGTCKKKKNGKKKCKPGKCQPLANGSACGNSFCQQCQSGQCVNVADGTACEKGSSCHSGSCACPTGTGGFPTCTSTQVCQASGSGTNICFPQSTCLTNAAACPTATSCGTNCRCGVTKEGQTVCWNDLNFCTVLNPCTSSAGCAVGRVCVDVSGCCSPPQPAGSGNCVARCDLSTTSV